MQYINALLVPLRKHANRLVPAGAVSGVLAASLLMSPSAVLGLGTGYNYGGPNCSSTKVTAAPAQPQLPGTTVTLTATATDCTHPEFKFFLQPPGGFWTAQSVNFNNWPVNTFSWNTTGAAVGTWGIGVWARHSGSTAVKEVYYIGTYTLLGVNCTSTAIATDKAAPQASGTSITLTFSATGCSAPQFAVWRKRPGETAFHLMRIYGGNTFVWNNTGFPAGAYQLGVWARQTGNRNSHDAYAFITFQIT